MVMDTTTIPLDPTATIQGTAIPMLRLRLLIIILLIKIQGLLLTYTEMPIIHPGKVPMHRQDETRKDDKDTLTR